MIKSATMILFLVASVASARNMTNVCEKHKCAFDLRVEAPYSGSTVQSGTSFDLINQTFSQFFNASVEADASRDMSTYVLHGTITIYKVKDLCDPFNCWMRARWQTDYQFFGIALWGYYEAEENLVLYPNFLFIYPAHNHTSFNVSFETCIVKHPEWDNHCDVNDADENDMNGRVYYSKPFLIGRKNRQVQEWVFN